MSAPSAAGVDVATAVTRADRSWCRQRADEPLDRDRVEHLAAAIIGMLDAPVPGVTLDVDGLRATVDQLRKQVDDEHREAVRAIGALESVRRERDQLAAHAKTLDRERFDASRDATDARAERDQALTDLKRVQDLKVVDVAAEVTANTAGLLEDLDAARAERDQLRARLNVVHRECDDLRVEAARQARQARQQPAVDPGRHRHAWEVMPDLKAMPLPCSCGKPWPRNRPLDTERVSPRVEFLKRPNTSADNRTETPTQGA